LIWFCCCLDDLSSLFSALLISATAPPNNSQAKSLPCDRPKSVAWGSICPALSWAQRHHEHPSGWRDPRQHDALPPPSTVGKGHTNCKFKTFFCFLCSMTLLAKPKRGKKEGEQEQETTGLQKEGIPNIHKRNEFALPHRKGQSAFLVTCQRV